METVIIKSSMSEEGRIWKVRFKSSNTVSCCTILSQVCRADDMETKIRINICLYPATELRVETVCYYVDSQLAIKCFDIYQQFAFVPRIFLLINSDSDRRWPKQKILANDKQLWWLWR